MAASPTLILEIQNLVHDHDGFSNSEGRTNVLSIQEMTVATGEMFVPKPTAEVSALRVVPDVWVENWDLFQCSPRPMPLAEDTAKIGIELGKKWGGKVRMYVWPV